MLLGRSILLVVVDGQILVGECVSKDSRKREVVEEDLAKGGLSGKYLEGQGAFDD